MIRTPLAVVVLSLTALAGCAATPAAPTPSTTSTATAPSATSSASVGSSHAAATATKVATASVKDQADPANCQFLTLSEATELAGGPVTIDAESTGLTTGIVGRAGAIRQSCHYQGTGKLSYSLGEATRAEAKAFVEDEAQYGTSEPKIGDATAHLGSRIRFAKGTYVVTLSGPDAATALKLAKSIDAKLG